MWRRKCDDVTGGISLIELGAPTTASALNSGGLEEGGGSLTAVRGVGVLRSRLWPKKAKQNTSGSELL